MTRQRSRQTAARSWPRIEVVSLGKLRSVETPADARVWMGLLVILRRVGPLAAASSLIFATGAVAGLFASFVPFAIRRSRPVDVTKARWQDRAAATQGRSMKNKIVPESLAERLALWTGKIPLPVVDTIFPLLKVRSLMAAERLGIFEALRDAPLPPTILASQLCLDEESLRLLLGVLVASNYLAERAGRYRLTALARKTLIRGGSQECLGFLRFNYAQWDFVEHLEQLLQTGQGLDLHGTMQRSQDWENYQRAMLEIARCHSAILARHVPVRRGARCLVDVGGSHGLLGAAICRRHPPLRSRVLELPIALHPAQRLAQEERIDDVVEHVPADLRNDELCPGADVILIANVVHHFSPAENVDLLRRAHRALAPGGTLAIWDIERRADGARADLGRDAIALFFRLTSASNCFSAKDLRNWLQAVGFVSAGLVRSPLAPLHLLVYARRSN